MAWYWVVLIIVGYFIMGILTAFIILVFGEDDEDELTMCIFLWPIVFPLLIIITPVVLSYWIVDKLKQWTK